MELVEYLSRPFGAQTDRRVGKVRLAVSIAFFALCLPVWMMFVYGKLESTEVIGTSMEPSLQRGDRLIVFHPARDAVYRRGEVVMVQAPDDPTIMMVKRIAAGPGDEVVRMGRAIYVNDNPRPHIIQAASSPIAYGVERWVLGEDEYFVLGDNRETSLDSAMFGPVKDYQVRGLAVLRVAPLTKFSIIDHKVVVPYGLPNLRSRRGRLI